MPGPYDIIYADPPWQFRVRSRKGLSRSAENHYRTMPLKEIQALPVSNIASKDAVLLMWATCPNLDEAIETIKAWGFEYKTVAFTWVKARRNWGGFVLDVARDFFFGCGYYTRANAELCLLATRGKGLPRLSRSVRQLLVCAVGAHSKKPNDARERIVSLFGDRPRVELFAREAAPGWDVIGNGIDGRDIREVIADA